MPKAVKQKRSVIDMLDKTPMSANMPGKIVGTVNIEVITPDMAANILAHFNNMNRTVNQAKVDKMVRDKLAGNWRTKTNDALVFTKDGTLLNGQHRLWMVFLSGLPQAFPVVRDAERLDQMAMDDGTVRTLPQVLVFQDDLPDEVASRPQWVSGTINGMLRRWGRYSKSEQRTFYKKHQESINFVVTRFRAGPSARKVSSGPVKASVALAWYYVDDKRLLERFIEVLNTGVSNGPPESAAIKLRDWLIQSTGNKGGADGAKQVTLYTQNAIRAFISGSVAQRALPAHDILYPLPETQPDVGISNGATKRKVAWFRAQYGASLPNSNGGGGVTP